MEWIAVKDQKPDEDKPCLVVYEKNPHIWCAIFTYYPGDENDSGWVWQEYHGTGALSDLDNFELDDNYYPTHWVYLPEPPKQE